MKKLYVGNVPFSATEDQIRDFFHPIELRSVTICRHKESNRPRGYAFVELADAKDARRAIEKDGLDLGGRTIKVAEANERPRGEGKRTNRNRDGGRQR